MLKLAKVYNVNINWLLTGEGERFFSKQEKPLENTPKREEKHPLVTEIEAVVDKKLEKIEAEIAEIKSSLNKPSKNTSDFGTFTNEPEPEYGEDTGNIAHADDLDREDIAKTVRFPYMHNLVADPLREPISDPDEFFDASPPPRYTGRPEDYVVAGIKGTSMTEAGIPDGSNVLLRLYNIPMHGRIQAIEFIGEVTKVKMTMTLVTKMAAMTTAAKVKLLLLLALIWLIDFYGCKPTHRTIIITLSK